MHNPLLLPIFALVLWTFVMMIWMGRARLATARKMRLGFDAGRRTAELAAKMPPEVQWKADNYNHLHEQPTLFYAVLLALVLMGEDGGLAISLAWIYVALRVAHSFVHVTSNNVQRRFNVFCLSALVLIALTVIAIARWF